MLSFIAVSYSVLIFAIFIQQNPMQWKIIETPTDQGIYSLWLLVMDKDVNSGREAIYYGENKY
ncbi:hypothetical protein D3C81_1370950 [compost metagenome]